MFALWCFPIFLCLGLSPLFLLTHVEARPQQLQLRHGSDKHPQSCTFYLAPSDMDNVTIGQLPGDQIQEGSLDMSGSMFEPKDGRVYDAEGRGCWWAGKFFVVLFPSFHQDFFFEHLLWPLDSIINSSFPLYNFFQFFALLFSKPTIWIWPSNQPLAQFLFATSTLRSCLRQPYGLMPTTTTYPTTAKLSFRIAQRWSKSLRFPRVMKAVCRQMTNRKI